MGVRSALAFPRTTRSGAISSPRACGCTCGQDQYRDHGTVAHRFRTRSGRPGIQPPACPDSSPEDICRVWPADGPRSRANRHLCRLWPADVPHGRETSRMGPARVGDAEVTIDGLQRGRTRAPGIQRGGEGGRPKTAGPEPVARAPQCDLPGVASGHLMTLVTRPAPTVRPPSRMANLSPSSIAMG